MNPSYNQHFRKDRYARLGWALAVATGLLIIGMLSSCARCLDDTPTHQYTIDLTFDTGTVQRRVYEFPEGEFHYRNSTLMTSGYVFYTECSGSMDFYLISSHAVKFDLVSIQQLDNK